MHRFADQQAEDPYYRRVDSERQTTPAAARAEYYARWEAVESFKTRELAALTEERAWQMILQLGAVAPWRERPDWSGLVEQQALFGKGHTS